MVTADRIPGLENSLNSTPEQIGVEVVLYAQRAREERFHPGNSIDAVALGYGLAHVSDEFQRVWYEGVAWARNALLMVPEASGFGHTREGRGRGTRGKRGTVAGPGPLIGHNPSIGGRPKKTLAGPVRCIRRTG